MTRRGMLQRLLALGLGGIATGRAAAATQPASKKAVEDMQKNWKALLAANVKAPLPSQPFKLTNEEWRKRLDKAQYNVLREEGTERPGTSPLNAEKRAGVFACAGCDLPLFTSDDEIRKRHRLAEFLHHHPRRVRHQGGPPAVRAAHRIPLRRAAAAITATSSTTARSRPASAGATTASR